MLNQFQDKSAKAECRIGIKAPGKDPIIFTGICEGDIVRPQGDNNFGWDPIFKPKGFDQTYAEIPLDIKNDISHRGKAMKLVVEYFQAHPDWISS